MKERRGTHMHGWQLGGSVYSEVARMNFLQIWGKCWSEGGVRRLAQASLSPAYLRRSREALEYL